MELWIGALNLGLLSAFMAMGIFLTYRVYHFADITVDGSFTTGAAAAAVLLVAGVNPGLALAAAFGAAALAGLVTALMQTRFGLNDLLAGILVMTGLYSVNLHLMGRSNLPLLREATVFSLWERINPGIPTEIWTLVLTTLAVIVFWGTASLFFRTDLGLTMRAAGANPVMAMANGVAVNRLKLLGVTLANGLAGLSGALVAQYQGFADVGMGIGTVVLGLAAVIIGQTILKTGSMRTQVLGVIVGAVVFRLMIALALYLGLNPIDLKLLTAGFVLLILVVPSRLALNRPGATGDGPARSRRAVRAAWAVGLIAAIVLASAYLYPQFGRLATKERRIGLVQLTEHPMLDITRDSFKAELEKSGCRPETGCHLELANAQGDLPTINLILDKFLQEGVDLVVTISTPATQAAMSKIKDRPVVFATVANPFVIGAGKSDTDHQPNITGVYGWVPMDRMMDLVRQIWPGPLKIGTMWDPAQVNSEFNGGLLKKAVAAHPDLKLEIVAVASTADVQQATVSLVQKGVDVIVLPPDNLVYSAFEAVLKGAEARRVPIVTGDVERLATGALMVMGYDYTSSGEQAARMVARILAGASPRDLPFERYKRLSVGINFEAAAKCGVKLPPEIVAQATFRYPFEPGAPQPGPAKPATKKSSGTRKTQPPKRLALFHYNDSPLMLEAIEGFTEELPTSDASRPFEVKIEIMTRQNDMAATQTIAQDLAAEYGITILDKVVQGARTEGRQP